MALVIRTLYKYYVYYFEEFQDPRLKDYLLVHSPIPVLGIIALYLYFVNKWGPALMKDRKPYNLKIFIRAYNIYQVVFNLYMASVALWNSYLRSDFSLTCQPIDTNNTQPHMLIIIRAAYWYYISKYVDLLDTIIFVLRKKNNQITFLHVYHHAGIIFGVYCYMKFLCGSHATLLGIINGFVHVFMYGYYFLSSLGDNSSKYAWCKKYITQIQLLQFTWLIVHFSLPIIKNNCDYPKIASMIGSHPLMLGVINGYVHVVMYGYYFLSSLDNNGNKYAWCKKYITQIQLLQFAYLIIHFVIPLCIPNCELPKFVSMVGIIQNSFMFALFLDFYIKTYVRKKKQQ